MTYAVVSGGFDPLHEGHVAYIDAAAKFGTVVVLLNSDEWLERKKGKAFMNLEARTLVLKSLRSVFLVLPVDDTPGDVVRGLAELQQVHGAELIFCKGGDRSDVANVPEMVWCRANNVPVVLGCGGYIKANSSSELIRNAQGR